MHRAKISSNWVCKNHFWLLSIHFLSFCQHIQVWKLKLQVKIISSAFRWPPFLLEKESASPVCVYSRRRSLIPVQGLTKKVGRRAYWPTGACLTRWPELIRARASGHVSGCHCPVSIQQLRNSRARTTTAKTSSQRFRPPTVPTQDARTHPHHL